MVLSSEPDPYTWMAWVTSIPVTQMSPRGSRMGGLGVRVCVRVGGNGMGVAEGGKGVADMPSTVGLKVEVGEGEFSTAVFVTVAVSPTKGVSVGVSVSDAGLGVFVAVGGLALVGFGEEVGVQKTGGAFAFLPSSPLASTSAWRGAISDIRIARIKS